MIAKYLFLAVLGLTSALSTSAFGSSPIPISEIEQKLSTEGLEVWIHGSVPEHSLYVISYRRPDNFFVFVEISAFPATSAVREVLSKARRHDRVRVWGELVNYVTSQPHVAIERIQVEERFTGHDPYPPYARDKQLPKDLLDKTSFIGKVHALLASGEILVLEYGDAVVPVFVEAPLRPQTQRLNRGDKVRVNFKVQQSPRRPMHLNLDTSSPQPIEVLFSPSQEHGQNLAKTGELVMFVQSPQIRFNVFALQFDVGDGVMLDYTLVNFTDPDFFRSLREKLQQAWDRNAASLQNARNKFVNPKIRLRVEGSVNFIDKNQANPQLLIDSLDQIKIEVL